MMVLGIVIYLSAAISFAVRILFMLLFRSGSKLLISVYALLAVVALILAINQETNTVVSMISVISTLTILCSIWLEDYNLYKCNKAYPYSSPYVIGR